LTRKKRLVRTFSHFDNKGNSVIRYEFRQQLAEMIGALRSKNVIAFWLMVSFFTILAGPFGTYDTMDLGCRAVHWGAIIGAGLAIGTLVYAALLTVCRDWQPILVDLAAALLITSLLAPLVEVMRPALDQSLRRGDLGIGEVWGTTLVLVAPIFFLQRQLIGFQKTTGETALPRLLRRLPEPLHEATILRLCARGHTVDVVTDRGSTNLRMRLADAIDEMEPVEGLWTHRSHWIARGAITGHVCEAGKLRLTLVNGDSVPVSRGFRPQLEAEGLVPRNEGGG